MTKEYGIIRQGKPQFPVRELLVVPHQDGDLTVSYPFFGPNYFSNNVAEMGKIYSHPQTGDAITFKEPTTSESISASAFNFREIAKPEVFDARWLQAGRIVRDVDGVYANTQVTDGKELKKLRDKAKKVNGIWILENGKVEGVRDFGFAPYETFDRQKDGIDYVAFADGGLARVLEHTQEKTAKNLKAIASPENYKRGVDVWGFDDVKEPKAGVVGLGSNGCVDRGGLYVSGNSWIGGYYGCAPGVLTSASQGAKSAKKAA